MKGKTNMKNNERGGIISTIILIPVVVALMAGFFLLGYFVGRHQSKSGTTADAMPPLPEIISKNLPKEDEFTFYKSLTDKSDKTVSIELKPKPVAEEKGVEPPVSETARVKGAQKQQVSSVKGTVSARKPGSGPHYTLQIAAYQEKEMAEADIKKMKQQGYAAFVVASELPGMGTWYRVRLGSFSSKASAEKLQKELRAKAGIAPFITVE